MSSPNKNNGGASESKSNNDGVCEMNDMLKNMSTADVEETNTSVCANCGKEGIDVTNTCNKCKSVMYCNAACKKKHRHKHKKECEEHVRLAAERAAELHDEKLFKQPPLQFDDCSICFQRMPSLISGRRYKSCCGKLICSGCELAPVYDDKGNRMEQICPFCRTPVPTSNEVAIERMYKRVETGEAEAINCLGLYYAQGDYGLTLDYRKALELFHQAAELGLASAYHNQ